MTDDNNKECPVCYNQGCEACSLPYYVIVGRRWFDSKNGNTYHSCEVYKNGVLLKREDYEYGYDDQYRQTGHRLLQEAGEIPKNPEDKNEYWTWVQETREHREHWLFIVSDVKRKADL